MWDFTRPRYADGTPRPMMRGWLHAVFSVAWVTGCGLFVVLWQPGLYLMCMGKLVSYLASANYHLYRSKDPTREFAHLCLDYMAIPVSMWASAVPFQTSFAERIVLWMLMVAVGGNAVVLARCDFRRNLLYALFFTACISNMAYHCAKLGRLTAWTCGLSIYWLAFYLSPANKTARRPAPWHHPLVCGWHEDFHLVLLWGDLWFAYLAIEAAVARMREAHDPRAAVFVSHRY